MGVDSVNGTTFTNDSTNQVIIGKTEAQSLNKTVGDTINLYGQNFTITGTFETGNFMTDNGIMMPLSTLQNLTSNQNKISDVLVKVTDNANVTTVSNTITNAYPNQLTTSTAADSANRINQGLGFISTASWAISLLAIFIGAVGVINTMVMTVYERTREIGVLKAVGWKNSRILGMILGESIVLTLIAFVVGTVIAVVGVEVLLTLVPSVGNAITPSFSIYIFLRAFGIALLVGVIGGLYPAYRASRLSPTEALRYE
jgi:putative ABC transport system permease protein